MISSTMFQYYVPSSRRGVASVALLTAAGVFPLLAQSPATWPQFRGPNSSGVADSTAKLPVTFGPAQSVLWKQAIPFGHSSPAIWGDRIFLTAHEKGTNKLEVICLSRKDGKVLWRHPVPVTQIEKLHDIGSGATATPAVDKDNVYVYFGSYGLVALNHAGKQLWSMELPVPNTSQQSGTSPAVFGDLVILNRDAAQDPYLLAVDRTSGKQVWKVALSQPGRKAESYSTPVIWKDQIILHRLGLVEAFDTKAGARLWWVRVNSTGTSTVATSADTIFAAAWFPFGEADQVPPAIDFATLSKRADKDGNGKISQSELPDDLLVFGRPEVNVPGAQVKVATFFAAYDMDKSGDLDEKEWTTVSGRFAAAKADHGIIAVKPEGSGDMTSKILWQEKLAIPEVPSPLVYKTRLYMVRNGGILSCLDAQTGKLLYRSRVGAPGAYYSSPIAANGNIYLASGDGVVTVVSDGDQLKVLSKNDLGEEIYATPAVIGDTLYVRTAGHLYAFRSK